MHATVAPVIDGTVLAYIPSPAQGVWHLGPLPLRAYAVCIIVGIVVAVWWGSRRWQARGGQPGEVIDVALWAVPFGLIGGRIYHVLTDWSTYFGPGGKGLGAAFRIWDGGLGIWGAVAFGAVGAWIGARNMGIKLPSFGDALAPAILLAQAIGRLGNYFNQELFGRETTLPWGLEIYDRTNSDGVVSYKLIEGASTGDVYAVVHPTFLYEMVWNVLVVIALVLIDRHFRVGHGRLFAMYVAGYCVGRFAIELMRDDYATHIFGVRINVFTSAIIFLCAALYVVMAPKGREEGLSMYWPDRAEELAQEGAVGYLPQTTAVAREADDVAAATDDDYGEDEGEDEDEDYDEGEGEFAGDYFDDSYEDTPYEEESIDVDPAAHDDSVWAQGADEEIEPIEESPVDASPADEHLPDETAVEGADESAVEEAAVEEAAVEEAAVEESAVEEAEVEQSDEGEPVADGAADDITDDVSPAQADDSTTAAVPSQGYTIVPADDEELSSITIIEQNPGGSAGSIEIRRSGDAAADETTSTVAPDRGDTPDGDG